MKVSDSVRTTLANAVSWAFKSSERAGTMMNRLVRWVDPTPRVRTEEQGGIPHKAIHNRSVAGYNAERAVNQLIEHDNALVTGKNHMMTKVFDLIKVGQRFEARLLMEKYLQTYVAGSPEQPDYSALDDELTQLNSYLTGDRASRRHSPAMLAIAQLELNRAAWDLQGIAPHYEISDGAADDSWQLEYQKAGDIVESMRARDPDLLLPNRLSRALLKQAEKGNTLIVRKLFEKALREQMTYEDRSSLHRKMKELIHDTDAQNRFSSDAVDATLEYIDDAYNFVSAGQPYPEFINAKATSTPPPSHNDAVSQQRFYGSTGSGEGDTNL